MCTGDDSDFASSQKWERGRGSAMEIGFSTVKGLPKKEGGKKLDYIRSSKFESIRPEGYV